MAAPKRRAAKREFDKGVRLYSKKDYDGARSAFSASAKLESDVETLYAWAQTERKLGNCSKAVDLYKQLLDMQLPAANKDAIRPKLEECQKQLGDKGTPNPKDPKDPKDVKGGGSATTEPKDRDPKGGTGGGTDPTNPKDPKDGTTAKDPKDVAVVDPKVTDPVEPKDPVEPDPDEGKPAEPTPAEKEEDEPFIAPQKLNWNQIGIGFLGLGAVNIGVGGFFLLKGRKANLDASSESNYYEYIRLREEADKNGKRGVIAMGIGGGFLVAGLIYYATREKGYAALEKNVTGWVNGQGGGVAAFGSF